jgi:hypothetical protein
MALGFVLADRAFKFQTGKKLKNLGEYTAYSIQG